MMWADVMICKPLPTTKPLPMNCNGGVASLRKLPIPTTAGLSWRTVRISSSALTMALQSSASTSTKQRRVDLLRGIGMTVLTVSWMTK